LHFQMMTCNASFQRVAPYRLTSALSWHVLIMRSSTVSLIRSSLGLNRIMPVRFFEIASVYR
jgi:hypothetical protein